MKKIIVVAILIGVSFTSFAQESKDNGDETNTGFKKQNLFTGGDVTLSFDNYATALGVSPMLGYSVNKWLDAGVVFNFIYESQREVNEDAYGNLYLTGYKTRQFTYGPGAFARLYPVNFIFIQAQFEENFVNFKEIDPYGNVDLRSNVSAPSLLLGAGYCIGRLDGTQPFFYLSVSADVLGNKYSPYVDDEPNAAGGTSVIIEPVIKGGIQIPLFQNNTGHYRRHRRYDY